MHGEHLFFMLAEGLGRLVDLRGDAKCRRNTLAARVKQLLGSSSGSNSSSASLRAS